MKNSLTLLGLALALGASSHTFAQTNYYDTAVIPPSGKDFVAYCFQTGSLSNALPSAPMGTEVYVYRGTNYVSSEYIGGWNPNLTLYPGEAFWIYNGSTAMSYRVYGAPVTNTYTLLSLTNAGQWYGLSFAYYGVSDYLECVTNSCLPNVTRKSLQYHSSIGDLVYLWDVTNQVYKQYEVTTNSCLSRVYTNDPGTPMLSYATSPSLCAGKGVWISPATANKTWVQWRDVSNRCCDTNCSGSAPCP